ncbi:hypothetical protein BpHYR1_033571, partial [Brachionus plicatilis]
KKLYFLKNSSRLIWEVRADQIELLDRFDISFDFFLKNKIDLMTFAQVWLRFLKEKLLNFFGSFVIFGNFLINVFYFANFRIKILTNILESHLRIIEHTFRSKHSSEYLKKEYFLFEVDTFGMLTINKK